jgi:hypothetical protein
MISPIVRSLFAEIAPTCEIMSPLTGFESSWIESTAFSTMPLQLPFTMEINTSFLYVVFSSIKHDLIGHGLHRVTVATTSHKLVSHRLRKVCGYILN